jgi:hypothetical protein
MSVLGNLCGIIGAGQQGTNTGAGVGGISPVYHNQSAAKNAVFNNAVNSLWQASQTTPAPSPPVKNIHDITLADLNNEAMLAPISVLVSMWLAKYQNEWVLSEDVVTDDFFRLVASRLIKLNKLEIVHVSDKWQDAYRLIEDEE